jgi:hypothetical protein
MVGAGRAVRVDGLARGHRADRRRFICAYGQGNTAHIAAPGHSGASSMKETS